MFSKSKEASRKRSEKQPQRRSDKKPKRKRRQIKLLGGLAAGAIGGIVATWALDKYQEGALQATRRAEHAIDAEPVLSRQQEDQLRGQERAHAEAAQRLAKSAFGKSLNRTQRRNAAPLMHYAVGALAGGVYGLTAEFLPVVRSGYGTGYASLLFVGGSEALLPGLDLGPGPQKIPAAIHAGGLSAHLIYGAVLETTRRVVRWFF
jgi:putative membrane protein